MLQSNAPDKSAKENLERIQKHGVADFQYSLKHNDPFHWGPYAMLVKDTAYHSRDLGNHDYLRMPEIIEDICNGYQKQFGEPIIEFYEQLLIPKVVKFESSSRLDDGCIEAAIYFAYQYVRKMPPNGGTVTCFDGNGTGINFEDIISVSDA